MKSVDTVPLCMLYKYGNWPDRSKYFYFLHLKSGLWCFGFLTRAPHFVVIGVILLLLKGKKSSIVFQNWERATLHGLL